MERVDANAIVYENLHIYFHCISSVSHYVWCSSSKTLRLLERCSFTLGTDLSVTEYENFTKSLYVIQESNFNLNTFDRARATTRCINKHYLLQNGKESGEHSP